MKRPAFATRSGTGRAAGFALALWACLFLSGCGYHALNLSRVTQTPKTASLGFPKHVTIAVKTFHNMTTFPLAEMQVTQYLKDDLQKTSGVTLTNDPKRSDVVVSGSVVGIAEVPLALSSVQGIEQYQVEVILTAQLVSFNGQVLWNGGSIIGSAPMYVNNNLAIFQQTQQYALNTASANAVSRLIQQMAHNIRSVPYNPLLMTPTIGPTTPGQSMMPGQSIGNPAVQGEGASH
jgi:hypothetical protein